MLQDLTVQVTPEMVQNARGNGEKALVGHLGTHFDVMDKQFPLAYTRRRAVVFDVRKVFGRDIDCGDIDLTQVQKEMFVAFYTGFIQREGYGSKTYFSQHPQLSHALIDALLDRGVSLIGIDFAGVRRGREHTPKDQYCADRGVFIIENLCHLGPVAAAGPNFTAHTYPVNYTGMTGLPCRVVAEF